MTARLAAALPDDPVLEGIRPLLGSSAPDAVVAAAAHLRGPRLAGGRLASVRYRPRHSCSLLWRFDAADGEPVLVSGQRYTGARAAAAARTSDEHGRYLAGERLLVQRYPVDAALPALAVATSPSWLVDAIRAAGGGEVAWARPVSYKPGRRCVVAYGRAGRRTPALYGKVFRDDRGVRLQEQLPALVDAIGAGSGWRAEAPVAYLPEARLQLFLAVAGAEDVGPLFRAARHDRALLPQVRATMRRAATGLRALHFADAGGLPARDPVAILDRLRERIPEVAEVAPGLAAGLERRLDALAAGAERLPAEAVGASHWAFRHDQLLLRGEELLLIDFDGACRAPAGVDPGNFLAYLDRLAVKRPELRAMCDACAATFRDGLREHPAVEPDWLEWHRAAALVKYALRSVYALADGWETKARGMLDLCEAAA